MAGPRLRGALLLGGGALLLCGGCTTSIPQRVLDSPPAKFRTPATAVARERDRALEPPATVVHRTVAQPYTEWGLQETAIDALARLGEAATPELTAQLRSGDVAQRRRAAELFARLGPDVADDVEVVETLLARLQDEREEKQVRIACARALGQMGSRLWPEPPEPYVEPPTLEPLRPLTAEERRDPAEVARYRERLARHQDQQQRIERQQREYYQRVEEYQRRLQLARRATAVLLQLARQEAGSG